MLPTWYGLVVCYPPTYLPLHSVNDCPSLTDFVQCPSKYLVYFSLWITYYSSYTNLCTHPKRQTDRQTERHQQTDTKEQKCTRVIPGYCMLFLSLYARLSIRIYVGLLGGSILVSIYIALDNVSKKLNHAWAMHGQSQIQKTVYYKQQCTY